jgi:2-hydroxychromene-2-carboxylate isomerase
VSRARDLLARRAAPTLVVALSQVTWPARLAAAIERARGRRGAVELYFAFDDPCSAVALVDLAARLEGRAVDLVLAPVVRRGIPGDPAVEAKRRHALTDARRLARRLGLVLARDEPLAAADTAFLAGWVAGAPQGPALQRFCLEAVTRLWLAAPAAVEASAYATLWRVCLGAAPQEDAQAVAANERRMASRGPYDTPAAVVARQWTFAHDRPAQIAARLDELGWAAAR